MNSLISTFRYINKVLKNQATILIVGKYFSYALLFFNSIFLAKSLGPELYGIWGFILLVLQYLYYLNFGVPYSVNVFMSVISFSDKDKQEIVVSNALLITTISSIFFVLLYLFVDLFNIELFSKYSFNEYLPYVLILTILYFYNYLFLNVFRSIGILLPVTFYFVIKQVLIFITFIAFGKSAGVIHFVYASILAESLSLVFFLLKNPLRLKLFNKQNLYSQLFLKGINLLFYNVSVYLVLLSSRTVVSIFFTVKELGQYTLANSVAHAATLGIGVLSYVMFPKMLNKFRSEEPIEAIRIRLQLVRKHYVLLTFFTVFLVILLFPVLLYFLPQYHGVNSAFIFLILVQTIRSTSFGYSSIMISRGKELLLGFYSLLSVIISILLSLLFVYFLNLGFTSVAVATAISSILYSFLVVRYGKKMIEGEQNDITSVFKELLPKSYLISIIFISLGSFLNYSYLYILTGFILFIFMNYKNLIETYKKTLLLAADKNFYKIN